MKIINYFNFTINYVFILFKIYIYRLNFDYSYYEYSYYKVIFVKNINKCKQDSNYSNNNKSKLNILENLLMILNNKIKTEVILLLLI